MASPKKKTTKKKTTKKKTATAAKPKKKIGRPRNPPKPPGQIGRSKGPIPKGTVKPPKKSPPKKSKGAGRPPFIATAEQKHQVMSLVGFGMPQAQIVQLIINPESGNPISIQTLNRYFRPELDKGVAMANSRVAQSLFVRAVDTNHPQGASCAMFWAKTRMGWVEKQEIEHSSKAGVLVVPAAMSADQWMEDQRAKNADRENPVVDE